MESKVGTLDLIGGPMFSGKTTELLKRLFVESETDPSSNILYINHESDTRSENNFSTHNPLYKQKLEQESKVLFMSVACLADIENKEE